MYDAFIIARLNSSRLVRKNVMPILEIPMIIHLANRIRNSQKVDRVIITTSNESTDDELEEVSRDYGFECYRGPLDNLMQRISDAAEHFESENIIEILGDNPLIHSSLIDDVIDLYENGNYDYAANISSDYGDLAVGMKLFSVGLRVQIYKTTVALEHQKYPQYLTNGKHPSAYIFENPEKYKIGYLEASGKWKFMNKPELNFAVNYPKNFELNKLIFEENYPDDNNFNLEKIYTQIENQPELMNLFGAEW
tara:strand:- start:3048 stop:3800 length:753 start_codon:yes stop_codon:yes gene_type:complete